jgi:NTP pyrophosphatase (non-canonical NTP hydrolase)
LWYYFYMLSPESETLVTDTPFRTVSDYEYWANQDWIHEHGTLSAQIHARRKFEEEIDELAEAISSGVPEDIISEAGDVLWTATANASNADVSLNESLRYYVPDRFTDGDTDVKYIDAVALELWGGFDPLYINNALMSLRHTLGKSSQQWFSLKSSVHVDRPSETFTEAYIHNKSDRIKHNLALTTLLCSLVAQQAGSSLEEVMRINAHKLSTRIAKGQAVTKLPVS